MKNIVLVEQLELGLEKRARRSVQRKARRDIEGASQWWFAQMRRVVDRAVEWRGSGESTPLQESLALGR